MAMPIAEEIQSILAPVCERIAIVGSLRRLKRFVGDIELLFIPRMCERPDGLFDKKTVSLPDELLQKKLEIGYFKMRPSITGVTTWGKQNKLAIHTPSGISVDLFAEYDPLEWWRSLVIRTGSKAFNIALMSTGPKVGIIPHACNIGLTTASGDRVVVNSEREFIEKCGLTWKEPNER